MKSKNKISLIIILICLCSCNSLNGEWKAMSVLENSILTSSNIKVSPFNTYMNLYYYFDKNEANIDDSFADISSIFTNSIVKYHKQFDRHYDYYDDNNELITNIKRINESYGSSKAVKCSDELYELLKIGVEAFHLTDGMFNIFTGGLTSFWEYVLEDICNYGDIMQLDPYYSDIQANNISKLLSVIPKTNDEINRQLTFDDDNKTVTFNRIDLDESENDSVNIIIDDNVCLTIPLKPIISVGGVAKGFATDLAKDSLVKSGYTKGYISSGGSSISTLSKPIYEKKDKGHKISVINPKASTIFEKEVAFSIYFQDEFNFSTSGNYTTNKSYVLNTNEGSIYRHHILNPFTGEAENYYCQVSVFSNTFSSAFLDCFSTALMNLSIEDGALLRKKIKDAFPSYDLNVFYLDNKSTPTIYTSCQKSDNIVVAKGMEIVYEI
ncbi:MAG: FAD:protein FMN transferase [Erysipelotrichaceae bacterium]|nr:FAD:protein FMN transferase [Erysipelotrichaceae bacterium]